MLDNRHPVIARIGRDINLATDSAEVDAARIERINGHAVAQHMHITVRLWQYFTSVFPLVAAGATAINSQTPIGWDMLRITFDRHYVNRLRFVRVDITRKAKIAVHLATDLMP